MREISRTQRRRSQRDRANRRRRENPALEPVPAPTNSSDQVRVQKLRDLALASIYFKKIDPAPVKIAR
jgi:hypothetical protein